MINHNGKIIPESSKELQITNRGFLYADAVFETLKYSNNHIHFWESHYFRLMSAMRIFRMNIPMSFTPEFLNNECLKLIEANGNKNLSYSLRFSVYRYGNGKYLPNSNDIGYTISIEELEQIEYKSRKKYKVELFKDYYVQRSMLSNLKSSNKSLNVIASIFINEQGFDNAILINDAKEVTEFINGNIFIIQGNKITTPPLGSGCLDGVMRKHIMIICKQLGFEAVESKISPFDLQKVDEIFMTNSISGVQGITDYRRTNYSTQTSELIQNELNNIFS